MKIKDPDDVLDYLFDFSAWLGADDTISSFEIVIDPASGLTKDSATKDDTGVTVWLSGGTLGADVNVTCRVVTAGGRTKDHTEEFLIRAR